ncbi:Phosphoesterase HXTX domain-containing protein [Novosphingobium lubricantis]
MSRPLVRLVPLIVTATLPAPVQAWADGLRAAHYPAQRNRVPAHVTLFQTLPGSALAEVRALLASLAQSAMPPDARLAGVMDLDTGTAVRIESPAMLALRRDIADHLHGLLTLQDSHAPRLHVTIQNKVSVAEARALQRQMAASFAPLAFAFAGLALHHYRDGFWEDAGQWAFRGGGRRWAQRR